ncbi:MAG: hypothetical protein V4594_24990 [Bacteroidota bacterium]
MKRKYPLMISIMLGVNGIISAQTLQTVIDNGNTTTSPIRLTGRADLGEIYDATSYGTTQIARSASQGPRFHLSFIRYGSMVYGMGFLNNSNVFAIQPGADNSVSNGIFLDQNGNAGIGTSNTTNRFTVAQNSGANTYLSVQNNTVGTIFGAAGVSFGVAGTSTNHDFTLYTNLTEKMRITTTGNIGIGTATPSEKLSVNGNIGVIDGGSFEILSSNTAVWANNKILTRGYSTQDYSELMVPGHIANTANLRLLANGNVGIGTPSPTEKLSVKGKIRAQEIKVETSGWADFVFAKDYKLPSLQATEQHILANGHLPGIPSAAEVAKDGIELGEMNKKLLQKIEELTLYLIDKEKDIQNLKSMVKDQGNRIDQVINELKKNK